MFGYSRNDLPGYTARWYEVFLKGEIGGVLFDSHKDKVGIEGGGTYVKKVSFVPNVSNNLIITINKSRYVDLNSVVVDMQLTFDYQSLALTKWQKDVFKQIVEAYEERLKEYHDKVQIIKEKTIEKFETNPLNFRTIEQTILRMNCISYMLPNDENTDFPNRNFGKDLYTGSDFTNTRVNLDENSGLDEYAAFVKFLEQAFEWNIMSYNFYPFYWGSENNWKNLYQYDCNDPLFKSFMQAGMSRVVVTVKPGFEKAVLLYMVTGKIWMNGHVPVYGDPLYVSMANELKEPEYKIDSSWETILPTNLLALQKNGAVINTTGLPNLEKPNKNEDDGFEASKNKGFEPIVKGDEGKLKG